MCGAPTDSDPAIGPALGPDTGEPATGTTAETGWQDGHLVSRRFHDVYFSRAGGLDETRAVFLAGCGLPDAWTGRRHFTVAELGFGTGLNMLALLDLWGRYRPAGGHLHLFSIEAFPLSAADAAAAHQAIDGVNPAYSAHLLAHWPRGARGLHRIAFPAIGATLDLMIADAAPAVAGWQGKADAWFLDGFAPAKNPAMWSAALLADVARKTAPGGRAATYSVAGHVRRALGAAGFAVERRPGFGGKRQRLEARMPGTATDPPLPTVAIIGAGIAGASLARAFSALGIEARVFACGPMASANPAALVTPRLAAASADAAALHAACFRHAVQLYQGLPRAVIATGVERLLCRDDDLPRARATCRSGLFNPDALLLDQRTLHLFDALVVDPAVIRASWLPDVTPRAIARLTRERRQTLLHDAAGEVVASVDAVVVAAGIASTALADVRLRPVRGQVTLAAIAPERPPTSWGAYVAPTRHGLIIGATHDRDDNSWEVRTTDNDRNVAALSSQFPDLAARLGPVQGVAGVRAGTFHNQPVAGRIARGIHALTGLGGHGFALAPLLAEQLAASIVGVAAPLPSAQGRLLGS